MSLSYTYTAKRQELFENAHINRLVLPVVGTRDITNPLNILPHNEDN